MPFAISVAQLEISCLNERRPIIGSKPTGGSSRKSNDESSAVARASPARFFIPPLSSAGQFLHWSCDKALHFHTEDVSQRTVG
jgi:hypothetical protein